MTKSLQKEKHAPVAIRRNFWLRIKERLRNLLILLRGLLFQALRSLSRPTKLKAVFVRIQTQGACEMKISLSWTPGAGNVSFNVYRGTTKGGPYQKGPNVATPQFDDTTGLTPGDFFYVVTGLDAAGNESAFSNEAMANVPQPPPPPPPVVDPPTGLQAVFVP